MLKSGSLNVLWFDPGGTTGWCCFSTYIIVTREEGCDPVVEMNGEKWNAGELGPGDHHDKMWNLIGTLHADNFVLGYESFEFRQGKQRDNIVLDSKEYIGVCKLYYQMTNPSVSMYLKAQTAADGKGVWYPRVPGTSKRDGSKLKALGLYTPGSTHMNDAIAHTLQWLTDGPLKRRDFLLRLKDA